jgi:hypothetical protein
MTVKWWPKLCSSSFKHDHTYNFILAQKAEVTDQQNILHTRPATELKVEVNVKIIC